MQLINRLFSPCFWHNEKEFIIFSMLTMCYIGKLSHQRCVFQFVLLLMIMEADFVAIWLSQSLVLIAEPCLCRWSSYWRGESQEGCREAPGGWDCAGVPAGLSWGGVRRQPPVPWPRSLPAQVWQLVFTLALQECLLQSVLHQISLDTDTGGSRGVFLFIYVWYVQWQAVCACGGCEWERNRTIPEKTTRGWQRDTGNLILEIGLKCMCRLCPQLHHVSLPSSPWKSVPYAPTCLCCAHIDQAVGICSLVVCYHFIPLFPCLLSPTTLTVWPCGGFPWPWTNSWGVQHWESCFSLVLMVVVSSNNFV